MKKTCVLLVLDGWGVGRRDGSNPLHLAQPKQIEYFKSHYLSGALQAAGIAVGLPWGEEGNSEVGHLTIGAGKVIYQHYPRITLAIQEGTFFKNEVLNQGFEHTVKNKSVFHIATLLTEGNIHASFEHLEALLQYARQKGVPQVGLHIFADGKDSRPRSVEELLEKLNGVIARVGIGEVLTLSGRHYALDRDGHWDRTAKTYAVMTGGEAVSAESVATVIKKAYEAGQNDEYIEPTRLSERSIADGDALFFADFREDSVRQIVSPFAIADFAPFSTKKYTNLFVATMTEYSKYFKLPVAFPAESINTPLGKALSDSGKMQMLIAETEKYAHVTYFFNGYRDEHFPNQFPILIPSRNVSRHDEYPQMMAEEIGNRVVEAIEDRSFDFILANFANADIVAHTGNFDAAVKAIEAVDAQLERIFAACQATDSALIITSDHGNVEVMRDPLTGAPETSHDANPVPVYVVDKKFARVKNEIESQRGEREVVGILSDVAPTVLEILGIAKPVEMTGRSLLSILR